MKQMISTSLGKRPWGPALLTIFTVGLIGSWLVAVNLFLANSQLGHVMLLLARHGFHLIPPALWLGAALIVALWLVLLHMAWHN